MTTGNNTVSFFSGKTLVTVPGHAAGPGYDLASGVGTVDAAHFVPELVKAVTNRPPDHDHGPPPCPSDGHHDDIAANGHGDGHCCPDLNGDGDGHDRCCPDPNGHGDDHCCPDGNGDGGGYDRCSDPGGDGGWSGQGDSGQAVAPGAGLVPGATGSSPSAHPITAGPLAAGASTATASTAMAPTIGAQPAAATTATTAAASPAGAQATAGTAAQPSTSTSTSATVTASASAGGPSAPTGYVTLVAPSGVVLGPPAEVRQVLRE